MQLLVNALCFAFGAASAVVAILVWAKFIDMRQRAEAAEKAKLDMEAALKVIDEEQRAAAEALQKGLEELMRKKTKSSQNSTAPGHADSTSVKDRLRRAVELTAQQSKINPKMGPEFVMQHNELELEKLSVLKSILADGFDPLITIRYNTGDEEMLLSSYIQTITKGLV